ncbi:MAG: HAD-IIA family hydrolase [Chloroflexi bacterium]|jgi:4-nitrophenyl phosphatase|nr:HAD-IIA family hydrolase [Anaerolineaceae bacterium]NMB88978.1 HAD-IIA family hydrolase [Chloroflexota bacterium]
MIQSLTPCIKALILDMDGVLWRSEVPIGNLAEIFGRIEKMGLKVLFATNNAGRTVDFFRDKIRGFGVQVESQQIVNSSMAVAYELKQKYPQGGPVYIVGEVGLVKPLEEMGFYYAEKDVLAVVAGMDHTINYHKLSIAGLLIRSGVPFYGTNPDPTYPSPEGLLPGAGTIITAIAVAGGVDPIIAGKPYPGMMRMAMARLGTHPQETLVIGDRLDTDILWGQRSGCRTGVVLSGVSTPEEVEAWSPRPDLIAPDLTHLVGLP